MIIYFFYDDWFLDEDMEMNKKFKSDKRTTPGIPTWSPTVVLAWPDSA